MIDFVRQVIAELRSVYNISHGPEIWLVLPLLLIAALISGLVGFLTFFFWEDDDVN